MRWRAGDGADERRGHRLSGFRSARRRRPWSARVTRSAAGSCKAGRALATATPHLAGSQKSVVVFRVADADHVMRRQPQLVRAAVNPVALLTPDGNHHRALVEDHLQFQADVADGIQDCGLMRLPGGNDDASRRHRPDAALFQLFGERSVGGRGEDLFFLRGRPVRGRPVARRRPGKSSRRGNVDCKSGSSRPVTSSSRASRLAQAGEGPPV